MSMIRVTAEDLERVAGQIRSGEASVNDQLSALKAAVDSLVGGDWAGAASAQFEQMYTEWNQGAAQLNQALVGISELLDNAAKAYRETEEGITQSMQAH